MMEEECSFQQISIDRSSQLVRRCITSKSEMAIPHKHLLILLWLSFGFAAHVSAESVTTEVDNSVERHLEALQELAETSGKTKLDQQFLSALRKLEARTKEPKKKAAIQSEINRVTEPGFPSERPLSEFEDLARYQKVYDASIQPIREQVADQLSRINESTRARLEVIAKKASGEERAMVFAILRERFEDLSDQSPAPESSQTKGNTLFRFSVLQEQLEPPTPRLVVPVIASKDEIPSAIELKAQAREAEMTVGMRLPPDTMNLEAPAISRTLLIYSGTGEDEEIAGTITLRGIEAKQTQNSEGETPTLNLELDGGAKLEDGELLILEKEKEFPGLFEIKAGPSTISVRGTQVFLLPENGDVESPKGSVGSNSAVMLVKDGIVQASLNGNPPIEVEEGVESMIDLVSLRGLTAEKIEDFKALDAGDLKYYPGARRWLLTDFDASSGEGLGPLVHFNQPVSPGGNLGNCATKSGPPIGGGFLPALTLSFPPTSASLYRYLSFDLRIINEKGHLVLGRSLWIHCGEGNPSDENAIFYELDAKELIDLNDGNEPLWIRVFVDLWNEADEPPELSAYLAAISFLTKGSLTIDNIALTTERPEGSREASVIRSFRDFPPIEREGEPSLMFATQRKVDESLFNITESSLKRAPERAHLGLLTQSGGSQAEQWFDEHIGQGKEWAKWQPPGSFSQLKLDEIYALRRTLKRLVQDGSNEIAVDLNPIHILGLLSCSEF
ncbi:MAG: hypothetical protein AAF585_03915, partial [Verrucomicrobiota bacterium]